MGAVVRRRLPSRWRWQRGGYRRWRGHGRRSLVGRGIRIWGKTSRRGMERRRRGIRGHLILIILMKMYS